MTFARLGAIGAEYPVPDGQAKSEIRICFLHVHRVVNAVHIRRDDDFPQSSVDFFRNADAGVFENGRRIQDDFKQEYAERGHAKQGDHRQFEPEGKHHFQRVKPQPG